MGRIVFALMFFAPLLSQAQLLELGEYNLSPLTSTNLAQGIRQKLDRQTRNHSWLLEQQQLGQALPPEIADADLSALPPIENLEVRDLQMHAMSNRFWNVVSFLDENSVLYASSKVDITFNNEPIKTYDCAITIFLGSQSIKLKDCQTAHKERLSNMTISFSQLGVTDLEKNM